MGTAQSILRTLGPPIRRSGAAESTTAAALSPSCQLRSPSSCQLRSLSRHPPILTIAPTVSQTGKQVGQWQRRSGAAESTARDVPIKAVAVLRLPNHMIAMLASRIGWRVGLWLRRLGVAVMKARAAHQQLVGVLEVAPGSLQVEPDGCSTGIRAIFRCTASAV